MSTSDSPCRIKYLPSTTTGRPTGLDPTPITSTLLPSIATSSTSTRRPQLAVKLVFGLLSVGERTCPTDGAWRPVRDAEDEMTATFVGERRAVLQRLLVRVQVRRGLELDLARLAREQHQLLYQPRPVDHDTHPSVPTA